MVPAASNPPQTWRKATPETPKLLFPFATLSLALNQLAKGFYGKLTWKLLIASIACSSCLEFSKKHLSENRESLRFPQQHLQPFWCLLWSSLWISFLHQEHHTDTTWMEGNANMAHSVNGKLPFRTKWRSRFGLGGASPSWVPPASLCWRTSRLSVDIPGKASVEAPFSSACWRVHRKTSEKHTKTLRLIFMR